MGAHPHHRPAGLRAAPRRVISHPFVRRRGRERLGAESDPVRQDQSLGFRRSRTQADLHRPGSASYASEYRLSSSPLPTGTVTDCMPASERT